MYSLQYHVTVGNTSGLKKKNSRCLKQRTLFMVGLKRSMYDIATFTYNPSIFTMITVIVSYIINIQTFQKRILSSRTHQII